MIRRQTNIYLNSKCFQNVLDENRVPKVKALLTNVSLSYNQILHNIITNNNMMYSCVGCVFMDLSSVSTFLSQAYGISTRTVILLKALKDMA